MYAALPEDIQVLVRGWLHGNCVRLAGERPVLVDSGYHSGAEALMAWLEGLGPRPERVLLTHVHSDHAGGLAALQAAWGLRVAAHPEAVALVRAWDEVGLWLGSSGQHMPRFAVHEALQPGQALELCGRTWRVVEALGHARGGLCFFREQDGLLISGDALWASGFGLLDPWTDGPGVFDKAQAALDAIAELDARCVIPGHGPPFTEVHEALARSRALLDRVRRRPEALRRFVGMAGASFLAMAWPELSREGLREKLRVLLAAHPPLEPGAPGDEALLAELLPD